MGKKYLRQGCGATGVWGEEGYRDVMGCLPAERLDDVIGNSYSNLQPPIPLIN